MYRYVFHNKGFHTFLNQPLEVQSPQAFCAYKHTSNGDGKRMISAYHDQTKILDGKKIDKNSESKN